MKVLAVRKEDDSYYQGAFWIVGDSVKDIKRGNFQIVGVQILSDFNGKYLEQISSKSGLTHRSLWNRTFKKEVNPEVDYNYYPRGRVEIDNKNRAIIYLNPNISQDILPDIKIQFGILSDPIIRYDYSNHYKCYLDEDWKPD